MGCLQHTIRGGIPTANTRLAHPRRADGAPLAPPEQPTPGACRTDLAVVEHAGRGVEREGPVGHHAPRLPVLAGLALLKVHELRRLQPKAPEGLPVVVGVGVCGGGPEEKQQGKRGVLYSKVQYSTAPKGLAVVVGVGVCGGGAEEEEH